MNLSPLKSKARAPLAFPGRRRYSARTMSLEIILDNVTVSRGGVSILDGVSLKLSSGGRVALLGGNGAGKSTLLKLLRGEIWPDQLPGGGYAGQRLYLVDGHATPSPIEARTRIGLAGADLRDLYRRRGWNVSSLLVVVSGLTDTPLPSGDVDGEKRDAALSALGALDLARLAHTPFLELSQGRAMSVLLARALVRAPEWIFLDEALDGLDKRARTLTGQTIERLAGLGVGIAAATHRPSSLPDLGFEAVALSRGRKVFEGTLDEASRRLRAAPISAGDAAPASSGPALQQSGAKAHLLIEAIGARVEFSGAAALEGLDWRMCPGENWVVAGPNGSGKSTLLKLLAGDIHPTSGSVRRFGLPDPPNLWELRARMGLVSWELQASHPPGTTVRDVLVSGFYGSFGLYDQPLPGMLAMAAGWMERLELDCLADRAMETLSQGQARRVLIGRALAFDPQVLLLDEPLGGLDARARAQTLSLLDDLCAQGRQIVLVTHNPRELPVAITHALLLESGRAVAQGPVDEVMAGYIV